jgi:hypothetical protein
MAGERVRRREGGLGRPRPRLRLLLLAPLALLSLVAAAQAGTAPVDPVVGTWYVNLNGSAAQTSTDRDELDMSRGHAGGYEGSMKAEGEHEGDNVTQIALDPLLSVLRFRRDRRAGGFDHFILRVVDGVAAGRYALNAGPVAPPSPSAYALHATAWNAQIVDRGSIVPRSFEVAVDTSRARIRLDRGLGAGSMAGRFKIYTNGSAAGEALEYDMDVVQWDGTELAFTIYGDGQAWRQVRARACAGGELAWRRVCIDGAPRAARRGAGLRRGRQRPRHHGHRARLPPAARRHQASRRPLGRARHWTDPAYDHGAPRVAGRPGAAARSRC